MGKIFILQTCFFKLTYLINVQSAGSVPPDFSSPSCNTPQVNLALCVHWPLSLPFRRPNLFLPRTLCTQCFLQSLTLPGASRGWILLHGPVFMGEIPTPPAHLS